MLLIPEYNFKQRFQKYHKIVVRLSSIHPVQVPRWALNFAPAIENKFKDFRFSRIRTEFGLNTERYSISPYSVRMRENVGKMHSRITPNTETFYAVTDTEAESPCFA